MSITILGKSFLADQLSDHPGQPKMDCMAIGSGVPSSSALGAEADRKPCISVTEVANVVTFLTKWDIEDRVSGSITEAGIFNASGVMFASSSFETISKTLNDNLTFTWTVTFN